MIYIKSRSDLEGIRNDNLVEVDFDSLMVAYDAEEKNTRTRGYVFIVLLALMQKLHKKGARCFDLCWIIESLGEPDFVNANPANGYYDLFYMFNSDAHKGVASLDIRENIFQEFGTVEYTSFVEMKNTYALPTWKEFSHAQGWDGAVD